MHTILRKARGILGIGLTWAVGWALVAFAIGTVIGILDPDSIDAGEEPYRIAGLLALVGLACGAAFGVILSFAERHKKVLNLSVLRAGAWGAIGSAAVPLLTAINNTVAVETGVLGALFAAATVAIARRADRQLQPRHIGLNSPLPRKSPAESHPGRAR